jgi:hypothetical protein
MSIRTASWLPSTLTGSSRHADTPLPLTSGDPLAGLTKHQNVRDQLLDLARGWTAIAQHERPSDARVFYASHHFTRNATTIKTTIEAVKM